MDLRGNLNAAQLDRALSVLDYQPFILSDGIQTGCAYSKMYGIEITKPRLIFHRNEFDLDEWERITDANARLRRMYDAFVSEISHRYVGGTLLDVACNNGYFPVAAELHGMRRGVGIDANAHFGRSIAFLNEVLGTRAEFVRTFYDPHEHSAPIVGKYTVVSASGILCHLPDPLNFLAFLGSLATEAVFFFGQVVDTEALLVSYWPPHSHLGAADQPFPWGFNCSVRLSKGLLYYGLEEMGFRQIFELPWSDDWLPPFFDVRQQVPYLQGEPRNEVQQAWKLHTELTEGSTHIAVLAMRR